MACPGKDDTDKWHLAADGCFKLPRLNKSNQVAPSQATLVQLYDAFNANTTLVTSDNVTLQSCSNFEALSNPKKSKFERFDETGVFGIVCARHGYPVSFVNMYQGESFKYSDHLLQEALQTIGNRNIYFYYDVGCIYQKHLNRVLHQAHQDKVKVLIPAFHVYAHKRECIYHLNPKYTQDCGLTDGEATERLWAKV